MTKNTSNANDWALYDSERGDYYLYPNLQDVEVNRGGIKFVSNGFAVSGSDSTHNNKNDDYIYIAIAKDPMAGQFMPTGMLAEDAAGTSMTLTDVTGEWKAGLTSVNQEEKTAFGPDAATLEFVASIPEEETGVVGKWGKAYWEVSKTADMTIVTGKQM